jgi:hypothetical protein
MTTGAPLSCDADDAGDAELDPETDAAADVAVVAVVLELLLEHAEAVAAASATQAKPAARRGHFFCAIIISPPYAELRHGYRFRTLIFRHHFRALYSYKVRTSMGSGHSSARGRPVLDPDPR